MVLNRKNAQVFSLKVFHYTAIYMVNPRRHMYMHICMYNSYTCTDLNAINHTIILVHSNNQNNSQKLANRLFSVKK